MFEKLEIKIYKGLQLKLKILRCYLTEINLVIRCMVIALLLHMSLNIGWEGEEYEKLFLSKIAKIV